MKTFMDEIAEIYQEGSKRMKSDPEYRANVLKATKEMQDEVHARLMLNKMVDFYNERFPDYAISLVNP